MLKPQRGIISNSKLIIFKIRNHNSKTCIYHSQTHNLQFSSSPLGGIRGGLDYDSNCVRNTSENSISTLEFTTAAVEALPTSTDPPSTE